MTLILSEKTKAAIHCIKDIIDTFSDIKNWVSEAVETFAGREFSNSAFYKCFTQVPRFVPHKLVKADKDKVEIFKNLETGYQVETLYKDSLVRIYFLLHIPQDNKESYIQLTKDLIDTADINELIALYLFLPLSVFPQSFLHFAHEGVRTNMTTVFDAITLSNVYPKLFFKENAWNQMVLKAIFTERPLYKISGVDKRRNERLSDMLLDYIHERWAAGRKVSPEVWRMFDGFLQEKHFIDLERLIQHGNHLDKMAVALLCQHCDLPEADRLILAYPDYFSTRKSIGYDWDDLGEMYQSEQKKIMAYQQAGSGYAPINIRIE